jgi:hypothetical protein
LFFDRRRRYDLLAMDIETSFGAALFTKILDFIFGLGLLAINGRLL